MKKKTLRVLVCAMTVALLVCASACLLYTSFHPITAQARTELYDKVLEAYEQKLEEGQEQDEGCLLYTSRCV